MPTPVPAPRRRSAATRAAGLRARLPRFDARASLLGVLLAGTLVLGGLIAREAHRAAGLRARTAQRALQNTAQVAAWEFLRGVETELDHSAGDALAPVTAARAGSPFEPLPAPRALLASFGSVLACPDTGLVPARVVRVDLRDGSLVASGGALPPRDAQWIADTLVADAASFEAGRRDAVVLGSGRHEHLALVYGVRFAGFGAPVAAYAFVTCPSALGAPVFERVMARRPLLPVAAREILPNTALVSIVVRDRHGHVIWRSGGDPGDTTTVGAEATLARAGGLHARALLRPRAAQHLAVDAGAPLRLGVLVAMLALTTGLALVAVVQLRREQDLARLRADFTSSVSHELRTPLAQIMLFGETLALDRVRSPGERRLAAETIVEEARRLMHMVDNVLHFARAERGIAHAIAPAPTDLLPVVRATVAAFAPVAEGARLHEVVEAPATAMVDGDALRQILLNLLDNAVKYGPAGQTITIGLGRTATRARVWVDDEGPGIPPADRERIWHPYVRLPRHRGAARGGSGIGLAVVRELALHLRGGAWVEEAPTGGARFVLELPLAPETPGGGEGGDDHLGQRDMTDSRIASIRTGGAA